MIKLKKLEEPEILKSNKTKWTTEYLDARNVGKVPKSIENKYKHEKIKKRLFEETSEKCAYCETKLSYTSAEVEHIFPKDEYPEKLVEWINLTIACRDCNLRKLNKISFKTPILNPYNDNPKRFLMAVGALILHKPGNKRGEITHRLLELNEGRLYEKRSEKIKSLLNLIDKYLSSSELMKKVLGKQICKEIEKDKEFSFVTEAYVKNTCDLTL